MLRSYKSINGRHIFLVITALLLAGCATIIRGTSDTILITSIPEGAKVVSDFQPKNRGSSVELDSFAGCDATPCEIKLPRNTNALLTVSLSGHESIQYRIVSTQTTSNDVLPPGAVIAGVPPGSHVVVGVPRAGSQIGLNGLTVLQYAGIYTAPLGLIDNFSGATQNLTPQAVTVVLAPILQEPILQAPDKLDDTSVIPVSREEN